MRSFALVRLALTVAVLPALGCPSPGGQKDSDRNQDFVEVGVGSSFSCGLKTDDTIRCWGSAIFDDPPSGDVKVDAWAVGYDGVCWVEQGTGALGCAGLDEEVPYTIPTGSFTAVGIGRSSACGVDSDGALACFDIDDPNATPLDPLPDGPFTAVSVGASHAAMLRSDQTLATGGSYAATPPGGTFTRVSAGYRESCALGVDAHIACWVGDTYQGSPDDL